MNLPWYLALVRSVAIGAVILIVAGSAVVASASGTSETGQESLAGHAAGPTTSDKTSLAGNNASSTSEMSPNGASAEVAPAESESARANGAARKAWLLVVAGLFAGSILVLLLWAWLWRDAQPKSVMSLKEASDRINAAASGIPTPFEMASWSNGQLRTVVAVLAEFDNYTVQLRPLGEYIDMDLRKRGDTKPRILVKCSPGSAGIVSLKDVRSLFASLAAEGIEIGWVVAPRGFAADIRDVAAAHRIILVGSERLQNMIREVPPISLPVLLAKAGLI